MEKKVCDIKVMVVCGGFSSEREVSLRSGNACFKALQRIGCKQVELFDLRKDNISEILKKKPDLVFLALHGKGGEDGKIQGFLELAGIPYTGSGVASSAICMDKILSKQILVASGIPTASFMTIERHDFFTQRKQILCEEILSRLGLPVVVKAPCEGSSVGVSIVRSQDKLSNVLEETFQFDDKLLIERYLVGIELSVPVLGNDNPEVLSPIEIISVKEFYDYEAKYTEGMCRHIIPARISQKDNDKVIQLALHAYHTLRCRGLARIDFIIDKKHGPQVIEANTLPGMTDMSLFPDAAKASGISFEQLVEKICLLSLNSSKTIM